MHRGGEDTLRDIDFVDRRWDTNQAYSNSKLYVTALAMALAKRWPKTISSAVDPGWVPTKMGGAGAPDDLEQGHLTQTWLAASDEADAKVSGGYWFHRKPQKPAAAAMDVAFQDRLITRLAELTGVALL
jgi:NAD(P)-dependent dehydrogenase (short-subunit alcohol dehydrogenase family)